jgi:hypothetical protein
LTASWTASIILSYSPAGNVTVAGFAQLKNVPAVASVLSASFQSSWTRFRAAVVALRFVSKSMIFSSSPACSSHFVCSSFHAVFPAILFSFSSASRASIHSYEISPLLTAVAMAPFAASVFSCAFFLVLNSSVSHNWRVYFAIPPSS